MSSRFNQPATSFDGPPSLIRLTLLLLLPLLFQTASPAAQDAVDEPTLKLDRPIERELAGGQAHAYRIELNAGQFLRIVVEQMGVDVVATLFGPDGRKLATVDSPNGKRGPEPVSWIAETTGGYRLEVSALDKSAPTGRYQVKLEELREAAGPDRERVAAQQAYIQFKLLRDQGEQGSVEASRNAIKQGEAALALERAVNDKQAEVNTLFYVGTIYDSLGETQKALAVYTQELSAARAINNRTAEGATLENVGLLYYSIGEIRKALDYSGQALAISRADGNRDLEADTLNGIGEIYRGTGDLPKALEYCAQSLSIARAAGDRRREANALNNIGAIYRSTGETRKALEYLTQSLPVMRALGNRKLEAITLGNIGEAYTDLGEMQKALEYLTQALSIIRAVNDPASEVTTLNNIGTVYQYLGEQQKALEYYTRALPVCRAIGNRNMEATTLNNFGIIYLNLSENQKALEYFTQAIPLMRAVGDRRSEAATLSNIGQIYGASGEPQKALEYDGQALELIHAVGDRDGEARVLNNIGEVYDALGERREALERFTQALSTARAVGDRVLEATTLNNIGEFYRGAGELQKALTYYSQLLPIARAVGNRSLEATALQNIGVVYYGLGEKQKALDNYTLSLTLFRAVGDRSHEASALFNLALLARDRADLTEARRQSEAGLAILESLRSKYTNQELRSSYFASVQAPYELYIDLLMRLHKQNPAEGFDGEALRASERARARTLLELLAEAGADIRQGVEPTLVERERVLRQKLNARAQGQLKLLNGPHSQGQADAAAREIEDLTTEFQQTEAQIRQASPHYAALTQPVPLSLREIQSSVLDADSLLLEYSQGAVKSYLWAVTPDSITSYELPGRDEIEAEAKHFYDLVNSRNRRVEGETDAQREARVAHDDAEAKLSGAKLSRMILGPAAAQLKGKRLVVVADGALQYIPFAALPEPSGGADAAPLVAGHEVVSLPSASTLAVLRREAASRRPATKTLAVLADPVFSKDDPRFKAPVNKPKAGGLNLSSGEGDGRGIALVAAAKHVGAANAELYIPRLPGTRLEADEIVKLVPPAQRKEMLDFEASRATATSPDLGQYRYVHFATHGFLDSQHPELSGVLLSMYDERGGQQDGFLFAHEVFNMRLSADVVVLSACQTGLGKEVKGEGLVGLTRGFMYAGSPRVVVSLWSVSDAATAELMARFYRGMLTEKLRPAAALRAAQISLMKERGRESPFFWAAFTLQGEWR